MWCLRQKAQAWNKFRACAPLCFKVKQQACGSLLCNTRGYGKHYLCLLCRVYNFIFCRSLWLKLNVSALLPKTLVPKRWSWCSLPCTVYCFPCSSTQTDSERPKYTFLVVHSKEYGFFKGSLVKAMVLYRAVIIQTLIWVHKWFVCHSVYMKDASTMSHLSRYNFFNIYTAYTCD